MRKDTRRWCLTQSHAAAHRPSPPETCRGQWLWNWHLVLNRPLIYLCRFILPVGSRSLDGKVEHRLGSFPSFEQSVASRCFEVSL